MQFIAPFFSIVLIALDILQWIILIWVIFSWVLFFMRQSSFRWRHRRAYQIFEQLDDLFSRMAYPFLRPFRRFLRRFDTAGIDWSPLLLLLTIYLLRMLVAASANAILSR